MPGFLRHCASPFKNPRKCAPILSFGLPFLKKVRDDCLLHMQAILRLFHDDRMLPFEDIGSNLLTPVSRQAMHHEAARGSLAKESCINLIILERGLPCAPLSLLTHAHPHI